MENAAAARSRALARQESSAIGTLHTGALSTGSWIAMVMVQHRSAAADRRLHLAQPLQRLAYRGNAFTCSAVRVWSTP